LRNAIVIGASMAGMLTARVLSEKFASVIILEKDELPQEPAPRAGVPQARHLHGLLPRGLQILEGLFPGIRGELISLGAEPLDVGDDVAWLTPQGWGVRCKSGLEGLAFTRDLLDWALRRRLSKFPNIQFWNRSTVRVLLGGTRRVEGVSLHTNSECGHGVGSTVEGDLVAVATGRNSAVPQLLQALGLPRPVTTLVNAHIGYASRMFRRRPAVNRQWKAIFVQAAPPEQIRGGILFPVEADRWLVTLQGGDRDYPPTDDAGFLDFASSLRSNLLYEAIKDAEPLTPITSYRGTENRLQHYDCLSPWPERLIVVGDAACAFNPVYGQGMTTAALLAEDLRKHLERHAPNLDGLARRFQKSVAKINSAPWMLSTSEDLRFRSTEGATPSLSIRLMHRYVDHVLLLGAKNQYVRKRFLEVQGMLKGPEALFRPSILIRVLSQALFENSHAHEKTLSAWDLKQASGSGNTLPA
jgi:2-polyprenyl-6-methoxyphenol hydroxylase-like FAD-dependent oxidoreductase